MKHFYWSNTTNQLSWMKTSFSVEISRGVAYNPNNSSTFCFWLTILYFVAKILQYCAICVESLWHKSSNYCWKIYLWKFEDVIKHFWSFRTRLCFVWVTQSLINYPLPTLILQVLGQAQNQAHGFFSEMRVTFRHFKRMLELNLHGLDTSKLPETLTLSQNKVIP